MLDSISIKNGVWRVKLEDYYFCADVKYLILAKIMPNVGVS